MDIFVALLPILIVFILLVFRRMAADVAGVIGWVAAVVVAWLYFQTPLRILLQASLGGVVASLPITLMVATSILQITIMLETGAIARLVALIKTVAPKDQVVQIMIVNVGAGTLLAAMGATPVSILPPIMLALGYSSFVAIALPALGYDALCTYALLGIPVVVFSNFVGLPVNQVGGYFARFMPVISTCIALGMLWIVGRWALVRSGLLPALIAGLTAGFIAMAMNAVGMVTLTGVAAGLGVVLVMLAYLKLTRRPLVDRGVLNEADYAAEAHYPLWVAVSPWLLLIVFAVLVNAPILPFFDLTFVKWAMPVAVIPDAPEKVRLFWQAYFWVLVSTLLALPFLKPSPAQISISLRKWLKRAPAPDAGLGGILCHRLHHQSLGQRAWTGSWLIPTHNMVYVVASASAAAFGHFYPLIAPFLGLLGGFVSGSETSAIAMLTALHLSTAEKIGAIGLVVAAASGIGGGLASVISPAKLQNASASIDRIGEEAQVFRVTFVISIAITAVCAIMAMIWSF